MHGALRQLHGDRPEPAPDDPAGHSPRKPAPASRSTPHGRCRPGPPTKGLPDQHFHIGQFDVQSPRRRGAPARSAHHVPGRPVREPVPPAGVHPGTVDRRRDRTRPATTARPGEHAGARPVRTSRPPVTAGLVATGRAWVSAVVTAGVNAATRSRIRPSSRFPVTRSVREPAVAAADIAGAETGGTAVVACAACHHADHGHDSIARRYCSATVAGGFNRQCVCVGVHQETVKEPS